MVMLRAYEDMVMKGYLSEDGRRRWNTSIIRLGPTLSLSDPKVARLSSFADTPKTQLPDWLDKPQTHERLGAQRKSAQRAVEIEAENGFSRGYTGCAIQLCSHSLHEVIHATSVAGNHIDLPQ